MADANQPHSELEIFRMEKDRFFKTNPQSPLTSAQKKVFSGLNYFPENPGLRVEVTVEVFPEIKEITLQTSTGDEQSYRRYGRFHFEVNGQQAELTIFGEEGSFFLPFVDSQAGKETYGAGRYLEPEMIAHNTFIIDFNLAYNPYCVYNEMWSCPLTPFENRLKVPVQAGEKLPVGEWIHHE